MIDKTGKDQSWWPNLKGRTVAILAAGPSMTRAQADLIKSSAEVYRCVINRSWELASDADMLYGCDWQWHRRKAPHRDGFKGMRVVGALPNQRNVHLPPDMAWQEPLLNYVKVVAGKTRMVWDGPTLGAGGNSAFQAVNLLARCGAVNVILVGVDCHSPNQHWFGVHDHIEAPVQKQHTVDGWINSWTNAAPDLERRGVKVLNCTPGSTLKAFPYADLFDALGLAEEDRRVA